MFLLFSTYKTLYHTVTTAKHDPIRRRGVEHICVLNSGIWTRLQSMSNYKSTRKPSLCTSTAFAYETQHIVQSTLVNFTTKYVKIFGSIRRDVEFRATFNIGCQWRVSRGDSRIKRVGWITSDWINRCGLYSISQPKKCGKKHLNINLVWKTDTFFFNIPHANLHELCHPFCYNFKLNIDIKQIAISFHFITHFTTNINSKLRANVFLLLWTHVLIYINWIKLKRIALFSPDVKQ